MGRPRKHPRKADTVPLVVEIRASVTVNGTKGYAVASVDGDTWLRMEKPDKDRYREYVKSQLLSQIRPMIHIEEEAL